MSTGNVPGYNIEVRNAHLALSGASEVLATLEADVEYIVKTGGLVGIACKTVSNDGVRMMPSRTFLPVGDVFWGIVPKVVC